MSKQTQQHEPLNSVHKNTTQVIAQKLGKGLTLAEAIDHNAIDKSDVSTAHWAEIRNVSEATINENVETARETINSNRLDADVSEGDEEITVHVTDSEDRTHDLPFQKTMSVQGSDNKHELKLVYEFRTGIHGYYTAEDGEELEATLWFNNRPANSLGEFDISNQWSSPTAKGDTILWAAEE